MRTTGITMIIRSLMGGGAERVMSTMANYWVASGVEVAIITSVPRETDAYTLDPRVVRIQLTPGVSLTPRLGFPWSVRALRRQIRSLGHKLVISFMDRSNIPVLLATRGMDLKVVVGERIDPRTQHYGLLKKACMRLCYPWADAVTVLTENVKKEWAQRFLPEEKVHVIHNPVLPPVLPADRPADNVPDWLPAKFFCCVGRLHYQKGFDLLFRKLPELFARWPQYNLVILGEGENRAELEQMARELGIARKVFMPGFSKNPHAIMQRASLFVFPSRWEGFPNALVEAMALGLPVVSFDCPSGPSCIVKHGHSGLLVPPEDVQGLAWSVDYMLSHPEAARRMGDNAREILQQCDPGKVMSMWEELIKKLCLPAPRLSAVPVPEPALPRQPVQSGSGK